MNGDAMGLGAFMLVLGLGLWLGAPTLSLMGSPSPLYFTGFGNGVLVLTLIGIFVAAIGAGILAWGVGTKE